MYLELAERPAGVIGRVQYNPEIFSESTILQMLMDLQSVLEAAIRDPEQRLSELGLFFSPPRELHRADGTIRNSM